MRTQLQQAVGPAPGAGAARSPDRGAARRPSRIVMVFVDGLGIGPADPQVNPVAPAVCPCLCELIARHAVPVDATMGMPGLPQSATGQAALLTGVNAARLAGRHVEGFPNAALRALVAGHNVFLRLAAAGRGSTFANAYYVDDIGEVRNRRLQSVTTVAALSAFGSVRDRSDLVAGRAVCHDLTRETLRLRGYSGPLITPEDAARHLLAVAAGYDFTLFEFFETDHAGHVASLDIARSVLRRLDAFLCELGAGARAMDALLLLASDHGNIEDCSTRTHTANPVPFCTLGPGAEAARSGVSAITDVTPAILSLLA